MTARTLEEIEREIGKLGAQKWYGAAHTLRLLAIAQEQRGAMAADEERTRAAAMRVWGEHVRGCDTADAMADLIVRQRAEIARLRADRVKFFHIAEVLSSCPMSCRKAEVYARHVQNAQELTGRAG